DRPHSPLENFRQSGIHVAHRGGTFEVREARDAVLAHAAGHDAVEVGEIGSDVEAQPMEADPAPDPDADGRDLVLDMRAMLRPPHPDADPVRPRLATDVERREG